MAQETAEYRMIGSFIQSEDFASHVDDLLTQHHVPGIAIAVVHHDQTASAAFGLTSMLSRKCTTDTLFDIASCSKSFTAAAIALLVEDKDYPDIQYDAKVQNLFPDGEFVMAIEEHTRQVTLDDILGHRTGMAPHDDCLMGVDAANPDNARSVTLNLRNLPVAAPVRSRYLYSNIMYTVLTYLIESRTRQSFSSFLHDRVFTPLEMNDTCLQPGRAERDALATGHIWDKHSKKLRGIRPRDYPESQGAGSVISSVNDMIKWVAALLYRRHPLTESIYSELVRMRSFLNPYPNKKLKKHTTPVFYAAGLDIYWHRGHMVAGHNGVASGFASRFVFIPDCGFGMVILADSDVATGVCTMLTQLVMEEVLQVPEVDRSQKLQKASRSKKKRHNEASQHDMGAVSDLQREFQEKISSNKLVSDDCPNLSLYTGCYHNIGYGYIHVQIKDGELSIDATNRSNGFRIVLKPRMEIDGLSMTNFTAQIFDWHDYIETIQASANERRIPPDEEVDACIEFAKLPHDTISNSPAPAVRLGLRLESAADDLTWFERSRSLSELG